MIQLERLSNLSYDNIVSWYFMSTDDIPRNMFIAHSLFIFKYLYIVKVWQGIISLI